MSKLIRCFQCPSFKSKALTGVVLLFVVVFLLASISIAEEQKKEEKSGCPYLKATSGCGAADKSCAKEKDAKQGCENKKEAKSGESGCESKSQPSSSERSCENKKVSSTEKCVDCKCCSACNCNGQKQVKTSCSCGDHCKCCASCCSEKA